MRLSLFIVASLTVSLGFSQPQIDSTFRVRINKPLFKNGNAPKVLIDEAHNNAHRKEGGLFSLTRMMEDDGAEVISNTHKFSDSVLRAADLLIIVNALHDSNVKNWQLPCPSAFTDAEIKAITTYLKDGGSLLLVADHMPMGGSVQKLAKAFGVEWSNSFAMRNGNPWPPSEFSRESGTLLSSEVTDSSTFSKEVIRIGSFTGSAFRAPETAVPFMIFDDSHLLFLPREAWKFKKKTKRVDASGWCQGAYMKYGKGRIVFLAEAAMITAQLRGKTKIGMNSPDARENAQLALNIFRYLVTD